MVNSCPGLCCHKHLILNEDLEKRCTKKSCHPRLSLSITIGPWAGLDLSSRGENIDSELSEGHVHQLDNPSAEEIKAPKDQTLVEVKPQGFDPRERKSG